MEDGGWVWVWLSGVGVGWGGSGLRVEADRNMSCQGGEGLVLGSEYGMSSIFL